MLITCLIGGGKLGKSQKLHHGATRGTEKNKRQLRNPMTCGLIDLRRCPFGCFKSAAFRRSKLRLYGFYPTAPPRSAFFHRTFKNITLPSASSMIRHSSTSLANCTSLDVRAGRADAFEGQMLYRALLIDGRSGLNGVIDFSEVTIP